MKFDFGHYTSSYFLVIQSVNQGVTFLCHTIFCQGHIERVAVTENADCVKYVRVRLKRERETNGSRHTL